MAVQRFCSQWMTMFEKHDLVSRSLTIWTNAGGIASTGPTAGGTDWV